jgi:hypothetical protein
MWHNIVELDRPQMTTWHLRIAWWITKTMYVHTHTHTRAHTHTKYVILIAFLLRLQLHERTSMLHYTYIACLVRPRFHVLCGHDLGYVRFCNQCMVIITSLNLLWYSVSVTVNVVCCQWKHCSSLCSKK